MTDRLRASTFSGCIRNSIRSFAALLFCANCQIAQKFMLCGTNLPFGPAGTGKCQVSAAIAGASRTATAQADGGL